MKAATARGGALLAACVAASLVLAGMPGPARASQADYDRALALGLDAYTYGLPLLETNRTFRTMTSINVSNGQGDGPVNQFNNVRRLNSPTSTTVVAPGANSLSSIAWLDLRRQPQVLHVPRVRDHDFVLALLDPFTNDLRNLGTVHRTAPGDYVIAGPGQHAAPIPSGTHRIAVRATRIWIIGSTQLKDEQDLGAVHRIQDRYALTPLSRWGQDRGPARPAHPTTEVQNHRLPGGLGFFDVLGRLLDRFPPPAADGPELRKLRAVGIGPGMEPSKNARLSADTRRGLRAAVTAGPQQVMAEAASLYRAGFAKHNGYLLGGFGRYGTNYALRAVVATIGLGAFSSDQAIFAIATMDGSRTSLSGAATYVMHMRRPPPTDQGWSLTVYTTEGVLVPNPINRYQFNQSSTLTHNPDGSVDFDLQSERPSDPARAANWLPTPQTGGFEVIWRLLAPEPQAIEGILNGSGWQPPAISATR